MTSFQHWKDLLLLELLNSTFIVFALYGALAYSFKQLTSCWCNRTLIIKPLVEKIAFSIVLVLGIVLAILGYERVFVIDSCGPISCVNAIGWSLIAESSGIVAILVGVGGLALILLSDRKQ